MSNIIGKREKTLKKFYRVPFLLKKLHDKEHLSDVSVFKNCLLFLRVHKVIIVSACILAFSGVLQHEKVKDVWSWVRLQTQEMLATGPTLSSDPIGIFSKTFLSVSSGYKDVNRDGLIPLSFSSITRYHNNPVRFKAVFTIHSNEQKFYGCEVVVQGVLNSPEGGMTDGNYISVLSCDGQGTMNLSSYTVLAFPPAVNSMLVPAEYFLYQLPKTKVAKNISPEKSAEKPNSIQETK